MTMTQTHKLKLKGQLVQKIEWKQTGGQMDAIGYSTFPQDKTRFMIHGRWSERHVMK